MLDDEMGLWGEFPGSGGVGSRCNPALVRSAASTVARARAHGRCRLCDSSVATRKPS
jgi:hypothetical protein